jgi:hypothetical protein
MSAIIYETINLYNKNNNILPYKYLGSDQHNKKEYLGSNKKLIDDIKKLGKENFEKKILCEFKEDISNVLLRKLESQIQKFINVADDPEYYNKTNSSLKGYNETEEERKIRMSKARDGRERWWNSLPEDEKEIYKKKSGDYFKKYKFSLIYLDMDLYKPTKISLEILSKNLVKNGLIVFDQGNSSIWGETRAAKEFIKKNLNFRISFINDFYQPNLVIKKIN